MKAIFAILILASFAALYAEPIADFTLENIDGEQVQLSQLLEEGPVLISFWAIWCINCKKEMPQLSLLQEKYEDITVICISIDKPSDKAKAIKEVKNRFSFLTLLDPEQVAYKAMNAVNPPSTYLLNTEGEIVWSHEGYHKGDETVIEEQIVNLLGEREE